MLPRCDLHLHTKISDGHLHIDDVVRLSEERGLIPGISDHISAWHTTRNEETFAAYLRLLSAYPVLKGGEICLSTALAISPASLAKLDYLIGSFHSMLLPEGARFLLFDHGVVPRRLFPAEIAEVYVANALRELAAAPVTIWGHPFITSLAPGESLEVYACLTGAKIGPVLELCKARSIALEISNKWTLPERFYREARDAGLRFSAGSDAHRGEQVARLDNVLEMARRLSLREEDFFVPPAFREMALKIPA